jgi:methanogenic corrinoid protein MtbC1
MRSGDCFIPEVLLSARTMQGALDILKPHMLAGESTSAGTVVIGTVEGDLHDIGKNLVGMMLQGAGFEVVNLGTGVTAAAFVAAVKEHQPQILGMSALLTTTLPHMAETLAALKEAGLRDGLKVMVGGAPVTQAWADEVGADGYGANAGMAVERAKALVA